jgi:DNA-binding XRE family transcriptional regulator
MHDCSRAGRAKLRAEQRRIDRFNALRRLDCDLNTGHGYLSSDRAPGAQFVLAMDFSGDQIRAARELLGLTRHAFADALGVSIRTVRTMEANGAGLVGGHLSTRKRVCDALEAAGVELTNGDQPGVRLTKQAPR